MRVSALAAALLGLLAGAVPAAAQGTTTGAISGRVTETGGTPVANVQVQVRNEATGFSNGALTREDGRYTVLGLEPGAYTVTARRIGFQATEARGVRVTLSQTTPLDLTLSTQAAQLEAVTVTAETGTAAIISPSRTGATTTITDTLLTRLPTLNRNFTDFVTLTPQVSSSGPGLSGGGTNNRFNNIQIDGSTESDIFGLGSTGQPGGQAGGKSIGLESVKEYQVLLSPYDVRQGNFAGVLINAVTKSGTNEFSGSVYGYGRNDALTRDQPYINEFEQAQYGFSLGGPIVRDRVLFFVNPEFQTRTQPAAGNYIGRPGFTAVTQADLDRFTTALESRGLSELGDGRAVTIENPLTNVFGRLDINLGNTQVVLRHNFGRAEDDIFSRNTGSSPVSFPLTNNGYQFTSNKNATVGQVRTSFANGWFNELLAGFTTIRDRRAYLGPAQPQVEVGIGGEVVAAGAERSSQANELDQDIFEITDNLTIPLGAHRITVGTQNQFFKFRNLFGQNTLGRYRFNTLADLETGTAFEYLIGVPAQAGTDGSVRFSAAQYSGYVQDEWSMTDNFRLTLGVRADVATIADDPPFNETIFEQFGQRTSDVPQNVLQWSPRVGFNWDVTGDQMNQLRGGVGLFTGRPAFVWMSNAFQNSGLSGVAQLTCRPVSSSNPRGGVPALNAANVATPPTQCLGGLTPAVGGEINLVDPDTKFPQNLRATLGYDRDIGNGLVATIEGLYTRGVNNLFYRNIAFADANGELSQEGIGTGANGRVVYGNAPQAPRLFVAGRDRVIDVVNTNKDYSYSITGGLTRRFQDNWSGSVFYTYSRAFDVQSLTSSTAFSQYEFGRVISGAHSDQELRSSRWDQPIKIVANGTYSFPTRTDVSLIWIGQSGARFDYIYNRDVNGDGSSVNDPIYVPRNAFDASEIRFSPITSGTGASQTVVATVAQQQAALESFIRSSPCLRENRGRILPRLACQEPFTNRVDVSVRQSLPTFGNQSLSVGLDVINFGNLLNDNWGQVPLAGSTPIGLITSPSNTLTGGTLPQGGLPTWQFNPSRERFDAARIGSNYQMQLSVRYSF